MSRADGFTLIEVLAVLFLTALVFGVALNFYIDLTNQSQRAQEATRDVRRATSLLDRVARDFERALLERKPEETDPLAHPWIFVAESGGLESGADRVRFVTRQPTAYRTALPVPDVAIVSYALREGEFGDDFELVRWSEPHVPAEFDPGFPPIDDPSAAMLADGIAHFALRFQGSDGEWFDSWDSSQLLESSELPLAVEIEVAVSHYDPDADELSDSGVYRRRVLLPVRPLDMETLLDPEAYAASGGEQTEENCTLRVADCVDMAALGGGGAGAGDPGDLQALLRLTPEQRQGVQAIQQAQQGGNLGNLCWTADARAMVPESMVKPECR